MTTVLGIDVERAQLDRWAELLAPERQPFWGSRDLLRATGGEVLTSPLDVDVSATVEMYGDAARAPRVELSEAELLALPRSVRSRLVRAQVGAGRSAVPTVRAWSWLLGARVREQADGHRFVWWRSLLEGYEREVLTELVTDGWETRPVASRHREVPDLVWHEALGVLPRARELAGTFPRGSGACCFATVLAAAGEPVEDLWLGRAPVEDFLAGRSRRGGRDDAPGTLLVWRSGDGAVQHLVVTIGGGWALHKPNQCWWSPRSVVTVREAILAARTPGHRLTRRHLV